MSPAEVFASPVDVPWPPPASAEWPIWVVEDSFSAGTRERLGEARAIADAWQCRVGLVLVARQDEEIPTDVAVGQADVVLCVRVTETGSRTFAAIVESLLAPLRLKLVLLDGDARGRERACRLAARCQWEVISPALAAAVRGGELVVTALDPWGRRAREVRSNGSQTLLVTLQEGVAEALPADPRRAGQFVEVPCEGLPLPDGARVEKVVAADPATSDIRHLPRIVAGGRGVGGREEFALLRRVAARLEAGVAASRMAVDLGWIEPERQVGQTGRTVSPELYLACGISGASHHLEGMSGSRHIVAINSDPAAPIFRVAHLGLVGNLHEVLACLERELAGELK